ncbi:MAG TPA: DUF1841 family protein [Burkholderiales bacterium]|nr:DUF1841 family protein [Burkholderiales bacterium]
MFSPTREQARRFFFETWAKFKCGEPLVGLEQTALGVILLHPDYHRLLEQADRNLDRDYLPEAGDVNPFLHLSLHLAVAEQLSIDQPIGIARCYQRLRERTGSEHDALHAAVECLGEIIWQAQRAGAAPDERLYFECLAHRLQT